MSEDQVLTGLSKLKRELAELKSHLLEIEEFVGRLESEPPAQEPAAPAPAPNPLALSDIAGFASSAEQASDQAGILYSLLSSSGDLCGTSLLLVENELGGYSPWNSCGFESDRWQGVSIGPDDPIARAAREHRILTFGSEEGGIPDSLAILESKGSAAAFPLIFGERVPAILYVSSSTELDLDSVRLLVELARLYIQNELLAGLADRETPSDAPEPRWPALEPLTRSAPQAVALSAEAEPAITEESAVEEVTEPAQAAVEPESEPLLAEPSQSSFEPPESEPWEEKPEVPAEGGHSHDAYDLEAFPDVRPEELGMSEEEFSRLMGTASSDWKVAEAASQRESASEPGGTSPEEAQESGVDSLQEEPLPEPPVPPAQDDEIVHSEARRFARLLVAEIKLYNEDQVQEGRGASDLYRRLSSDIDRSREMYEKRVSPLVRASEDYFHSEMIRVLAQEDPELMGPGYPGPQVGTPS